MNKKKYIMPQLNVVVISKADLICTSLPLYDGEADFAGARGDSSDEFFDD